MKLPYWPNPTYDLLLLSLIGDLDPALLVGEGSSHRHHRANHGYTTSLAR